MDQMLYPAERTNLPELSNREKESETTKEQRLIIVGQNANDDRLLSHGSECLNQ
jgi:hypothetical protein